jgi:glycosyltransferase involved in cell wall biosynthesis
LPVLPEFRSAGVVPQLWNELSSFDVIHGYNMELHPAVGFLRKYKDVGAVAHLNSYTYIDKRRLGMELSGGEMLYNDYLRPTIGRMTKSLVSEIDYLIALSDSIKSIYKDEPGINTNITHITNMIDPEFTPDTVTYSPGETIDLLYVGALSEHKGVEHLIRAVPELDHQVHLKIVGDGPTRNTLENLANDLCSSGAIQFTGYVPHEEISEHYSESDIFVHPGTWPEPLNRTLLEAMQHGMAVVSTDRGGPAEVIQDEQLLASAADPPDLAASIDYAVGRREQIGRRQRRYVLEEHHPANVIADISRLYETVA